MEKIYKDKTHILSPIKMYWDDLEEIVQIISKDREIEIESDNFRYSDLEELKNNTKKDYINNIRIYAKNTKDYTNSIYLNIEPKGIYIHGRKQSEETSITIKENIKKYTSWYQIILPPTYQGIFLGLILGPFLTSTYFYFKEIPKENTFLTVLALVIELFIFFIINFFLFSEKSTFGSTRIFTVVRKNKLSFWEKNKNDIITGIIIQIFVFLFGFLVGKIL